MNIREALRQQAPSLALQRAAGDEIARLDDIVNRQQQIIYRLQGEIDEYTKEARA